MAPPLKHWINPSAGIIYLSESEMHYGYNWYNRNYAVINTNSVIKKPYEENYATIYSQYFASLILNGLDHDLAVELAGNNADFFSQLYSTASVVSDHMRSTFHYRTKHFTSLSDDRISDDVLFSQSSPDAIRGGGGDDLLITYEGHDSAFGGSGNDRIYTGKGNDEAFGGDGNDRIYGDGDLRVYVKKGAVWHNNALHEDGWSVVESVTVDGVKKNGGLFEEERGEGNDTLFGGNGNDVIFGGKGSDDIFGGNGNDFIDAGPRGGENNKDDVHGGAGRDVFYIGGERKPAEEDGNAIANFALDFMQSAPADAAGNIVGDATSDAFSDSVTMIMSTVTASFLSGLGGALAGELISSFVSSLSGGTNESRSADIIHIHDFNPLDDILIIPMDTNSQLYSSVQEFERNGKKFVNLQFTYQADTNNNPIEDTHFAEIEFSTDYLRAVGVWDEIHGVSADALPKALALIKQVASYGVNVDDSGRLGNVTTHGGPQSFIDSASISGATDRPYIKIIGATGALVKNSEEDLVIGGSSGDILNGNVSLIAPGSELSDADVNTNAVTIYGFDGHDRIYGGKQADDLYGGNGNDRIFSLGTDGNVERIEGGTGDDKVIAGRSDTDSYGFRNKYDADGGTGYDTFDFKFNATGVELVHSSYGDDNSTSNELVGHDRAIYNQNGDVVSEAYSGEDPQFQLANFEAFFLTREDDYFIFDIERATDIDVSGRNGDDVLSAGAGNDRLAGGRGNDFMFGNGGDDRIYGSKGDDSLYGDSGDDRVYGGDGDDVLHGGDGDDKLIGGKGADRFVFGSNSGDDWIADFEIERDQIELAGTWNSDNTTINRDGSKRAILSNGEDEIDITGRGAGELTLDNFDFM